MAEESKESVWMHPVLTPNSALSQEIALQRVVILKNVPSKNVQKMLQFLKTEMPINSKDTLGHLKRVNSNKRTTKGIAVLLCTESRFEQQGIASNTSFWNGMKPLLAEEDIDEVVGFENVPLNAAPNKELQREWSDEYWPISKPPLDECLKNKLKNHRDASTATASKAFDFGVCSISKVSSIECMYPITTNTQETERFNASKCMDECLLQIQSKYNKHYKHKNPKRMYLKAAVIFDPISKEIVCGAYDRRDILKGNRISHSAMVAIDKLSDVSHAQSLRHDSGRLRRFTGKVSIIFSKTMRRYTLC